MNKVTISIKYLKTSQMYVKFKINITYVYISYWLSICLYILKTNSKNYYFIKNKLYICKYFSLQYHKSAWLMNKESAESLTVVLMNAACHCCMRGRMKIKRVSGYSQVVMRRLLSTIILKIDLPIRVKSVESSDDELNRARPEINYHLKTSSGGHKQPRPCQ